MVQSSIAFNKTISRPHSIQRIGSRLISDPRRPISYHARRSNSGSFAMSAAIRQALSHVSKLAMCADGPARPLITIGNHLKSSSA